MALAGIAWGVYSVRGARTRAPLAATAGNFLKTLPLAALLALLCRQELQAEPRGVWLAVGSGALASALGYVVWYAALRYLLATTAALVQLTVPILTALAGVVFMGETFTARC